MKKKGTVYMVGSGVLGPVKKVSALPKGMYRYRGGNTYAEGGVFIAKMNQSELTVDGNSRFSFEGFSGLVMGGPVGGGGTKKSDKEGVGTYTLSNGEMVLNYARGQTTKHSVFLSVGEKTTMLVFDGKFYFKKSDGIP